MPSDLLISKLSPRRCRNGFLGGDDGDVRGREKLERDAVVAGEKERECRPSGRPLERKES